MFSVTLSRKICVLTPTLQTTIRPTAKKRKAEEYEEPLKLDPENVSFGDQDLEDFDVSMDDEDCSLDAPETGAQYEDAPEVKVPAEEAPEVNVPLENEHTKNRKCARVEIKNATKMSKSQSDLLRKNMIEKIMKMKKGDAPRFDEYFFATGVVVINCRDKISQQWLVQTVPTLQPWNGAKLTATIVRVPAKPMNMILKVPHSEVTDTAHVLSLLKAQNRGLNTEDWTVLANRDVQAGNLITVSVDERSAVALKETGYSVCLGLKRLTFNRANKQ